MALALKMHQVTVEEEFKRNPELKASDLELLRVWLETQPHLPEISEHMLILLHHSSYYDMALTKETIENHYTLRTNTPEFFTNRDVTVPDLAKSLQVINFAPLPVPDANGNRILYVGLRDFEPNNFVPEDGSKLLFMTAELAGEKLGTLPGFQIIFDMKGSKLKHLARVNLSVLRKYILYGEKGIPLRRKEIHVINVVPWIDKLMILVKPWISKHTMDNLYFHGDDLESLQKYIPVECLPKELGGVLDSVEVYHETNCRYLASMSEYFAEDEKLRVDESKRLKKAGGQDDMDLQGTFRKLELD